MNMKYILVTFLLIFTLSSCWNNKNTDTKELIDNAPDNIEETIDINDVKVEKNNLDTNNIAETKNDIVNKSKEENFFKLSQKALEDLNIKLCKAISDDNYKSNCINDIVNKKIDIWNIDLNFCNEISIDETKNRCLDVYYKKEALSSWDINMCSSISDSMQKNICQYDIYNKNKDNIDDVKYCDIFTDDIQKNSCITNVNKNLTNNTYVVKSCDRFSDPIQKQSCRRDVILKNAREWINKCNIATDIMLKDECIFEYNVAMGVKNKTKLYCDKIDVPMQKDRCIQLVVEKLNKNNSTNEYCSLYSTNMKQETCKSTFNTASFNNIEITPKEFCDNLMTNNDGSNVDIDLCYRLTWVN